MRTKLFGINCFILFALFLTGLLISSPGKENLDALKSRFAELKSEQSIKRLTATIIPGNKYKVSVEPIKRALLKKGIKVNPSVRLRIKGKERCVFKSSKDFAVFQRSSDIKFGEPGIPCELVFYLNAEVLLIIPDGLIFLDESGNGGELVIEWIEPVFLEAGSHKRLAFEFHLMNKGSGPCGKSASGSFPIVHIHNYTYSTRYGDYIFGNNTFNMLEYGPYTKTNIDYPNGAIEEIENLGPGKRYTLVLLTQSGFCIKNTCRPKGATGIIMADIRYRVSPNGEFKVSPIKSKDFNFNVE